eukprot:CAMPEP_0203815284 /NCGR_PEP_ID=MMETSP0115-20131106/9617_1 /ASSEMBLY_ACC=CAM_ASM_000227 /TAXON_ID=33651 /ORGANISM="Bicosoecid sp, Strain ms1" /LENGTH=180 /DNA_ID=CAMNT_0050724179 /DNA_START=101 /DNA_END=643 /DNA_ORIENTATION=-
MSTTAESRHHHHHHRDRGHQRVANQLQRSDNFSRSLLAVTSGYFLLDLIALETSEKSPLDVGQSICLLMSMAVFCIAQPIDTKEKYSAVQLVLVLIIGSTALDFVDAAFNMDSDRLLTVIPPLLDIILSVAYIIWILVVLRRTDTLFNRIGTVQSVAPGADPKDPEEMESESEKMGDAGV